MYVGEGPWSSTKRQLWVECMGLKPETESREGSCARFVSARKPVPMLHKGALPTMHTGWKPFGFAAKTSQIVVLKEIQSSSSFWYCNAANGLCLQYLRHHQGWLTTIFKFTTTETHCIIIVNNESIILKMVSGWLVRAAVLLTFHHSYHAGGLL